MASAQVVETSVTNNSPSQDSYHPDDLFQSRHSFVNVLVRPASLVLKEHFFCTLSVLSPWARLVGLISTKTIEYDFWPPFMQSVHGNTIGSRPSAFKG